MAALQPAAGAEVAVPPHRLLRAGLQVRVAGGGGRRSWAVATLRWAAGWVAVGLLLPTDASWQFAVGVCAGLAALRTWALFGIRGGVAGAPGGGWRQRQHRPALCLAVLGVAVKAPGLLASFAANSAAVQAALLGCAAAADGGLPGPVGQPGSGSGSASMSGLLGGALALGLEAGAGCTPEAATRLR